MRRARPGMRLVDVADEAVRNLTSGTTRATLFALLLAGLCLLLTAFDLISVTGMVSRAQAFSERGGSITVISAEDGIDGRVCDSLAEHDGVRAAGALKKDGDLAFGALPQNAVTLYAASPGYAGMLPASTGSRHDGLLLPASLAQDLGARLGDPIGTRAGTTRLGGTYEYPDDGRPPGMGYAAIAPASAGAQRFDECWLDAHPTTKATTDLLYTTLVPDLSADISPQVAQHNASLGRAGDPAADYLARDTRAMPLIAALVGLLVGFIAIWVRRLELASALHTGARRLDQLLTCLLETVAWTAVAVIATLPMILYAARSATPAADHLAVVVAALLIPASCAAGTLLGAAAATGLIREDRLFAYFKGR